MNTQQVAIVILAAGKGTRMKSPLPKVLHPVAGRPMLLRALDAAAPLNPSRTLIITGYASDQVENAVTTANYNSVEFIEQTEQLGTGHAVMQTEAALKDFSGTVIILYGDAPLIPSALLQQLAQTHNQNNNDLTMITGQMDAPKGLGRIIRDENGKFLGSVEEKECTPEQLQSREVNPCLYALKKDVLFKLLSQVDNNNSKGEYYLTAIEKLAVDQNLKVETIDGGNGIPLIGANSRVELAVAEEYFQNQRRQQLLEGGTIMPAPHTVFFNYDTKIGNNVTIEHNVVFAEGVIVEDNAHIKAFCHLEGAKVGNGAIVGPFARLRKGTVLKEGAKIGNFVEVKNAIMGEESKANHLSYVGDAEVGSGANIGAGTIIANYNHKTKAKNKTEIGTNASTGANSVIVAPAKIGVGATIAAGTIARKDVAEDALLVDKPEQITKPNYGKK